MELVRQIQSSFYQPVDEAEAATNVDDAIDDEGGGGRRWLSRDPHDASVLYNLPLWRVQWTELPGYQNVLNVHVPHYTHMFRTLLLQHPEPWYFGHVYLPGGSENLANPDYFLPERGEGDDDDDPPREEAERPRGVPTVGTLMRVTDYSELEDGRLALVVQGVGRMEVLAASQQVPYAVASEVRLLPDAECWEPRCSSVAGAAPIDSDLSTAYGDASRAVAAKESELLRDLEYYRTVAEEHVTSDGAVMVSGVSPLSNVNGSVSVDFDEVEEQLQDAMTRFLSRRAEECGGDDVLLASTTFQVSNYRDHQSSAEEDVIAKERDVWVKLDEMVRLLEKAQPGSRIPVPSQLLGLLPTNAKWPKEFRLEEYADRLEVESAKIGTYSKSPFVRLSRVYPEYPSIRRAGRLSYTVWLLIDGVSDLIGAQFSKEEYLNTLRVSERLRKTVQHLVLINNTIKGLIG